VHDELGLRELLGQIPGLVARAVVDRDDLDRF
jgi:hypothetical protein